MPADHPQGDPGSVICRHCNEGKVRHNGVLVCDAPLLLLRIETHDCPHDPQCPRSAAA